MHNRGPTGDVHAAVMPNGRDVRVSAAADDATEKNEAGSAAALGSLRNR
jgi:hypothetical protein